MGDRSEPGQTRQDYSKRFAIVLSRGLEPWMALNAAAHIAAYLGNKLIDTFDTGDSFTTRDGAHYPRNSQFPIIVLSATREMMHEVGERARHSGLLYHCFIREMIETSDDDAIARVMADKAHADVECLGVGVFGPTKQVSTVTKSLSLWKNF